MENSNQEAIAVIIKIILTVVALVGLYLYFKSDTDKPE
jgi:hypothetical protein